MTHILLLPCFFKCQSTLQFHRGTLTVPCHSEAEPEVQGLLVSDTSPDSFRLAWLAEEDAFDTFVIMVSQVEEEDRPRELVLGGEERSTEITDLREDTEYRVEVFGLIFGRRSKSVTEGVRTGTRGADGDQVWNGILNMSCPSMLPVLSFMVTA